MLFHRSKVNPLLQIPAPGQPDNTFLTIVLLVGIGILAWLRYHNRRFLVQLFGALVNINFFRQQLREEEGVFKWQSALVLLVSLIITAVFGTICLLELGINWAGSVHMLFFSLLFGIALFHIGKTLLITATGFALGFGRLAFGNVYFNYLFYNVTGLLLLPIVVAGMYLSAIPAAALAKVGLGVLAFVLAVRLARLFFKGMRQTNISLLHFILYLCSLEILPLVVLYKVLIDKIQ